MCGRFAISQPRFMRIERALRSSFGDVETRYNISPSDYINVIYQAEGGYVMSEMQWGMVPSWSKASITTYSTFNASIETVAEKPMFRAALSQRRCLIPASGFFEWRTENEIRQPYYFSMADGEEMALAGLWDEWKGKDGEILHSCAILVGHANSLVNKVHGRMPTIIPDRLIRAWLDPSGLSDYLLAMLSTTYPVEEMRMWKVDRRVNSKKNQGASLITPKR